MSIYLVCHGVQGTLKKIEMENLPQFLQDKQNTVWLDAKKTDPNLKEILERQFRFHPLAIEDCFETIQHSKIERYDDFLFLTLPLVVQGNDRCCFQSVDFAFFWGPNYVVSVRSGDIQRLSEFQKNFEQQSQAVASGPDFLMERLLHLLFEDTLSCLQCIQQKIEGLEERIFAGGKKEDFAELLKIRKDVADLKHVLEAEESTFEKLSRGEFTQVCETCLPYLRDIKDHISHLNLYANRFQIWVSGLLTAHQVHLAEKTNEVMKVLTIIATLLLPLGLVTGFFGMNFMTLPGLRHPFGWLFAVGGMASIVGGMIWFFKKKNWL